MKIGPRCPLACFSSRDETSQASTCGFRDIAEWPRIIRTRTEEVHARESERLYDEGNLAFAQQLKNKDIPEGGAKAAVLADPYAGTTVW